MTMRFTRGVMFALLLSALIWGGVALSAWKAWGAPDKPVPPGSALCVDDVCKPSEPDPAIEPIPPDAPPVVKLRHQLAKERREHRAAIAACRAGR